MVRFAELTNHDCPLLRDTPEQSAQQLVELYNVAARLANDVAKSDIAVMFDREESRRLLKRLETVRNTLTRARYLVGFLGTSSAGKSTIFNRVLHQEIAKSGAGDATTSLPSRLRRADGANACRLMFLSLMQYEDRRKKLCLALGLGTPPTSNAELLSLLSQPIKQDEANARPLLEHDVAYLRSFLDSYDKFGKQRVKVEPVAWEVEFEKRADYINHGPEKEPISENRLLREAQLAIANERIPAELEMCDLPGLNSKRSVDTIITTDFLDELDGALVFVNVAENLFNANVSDILARLKQRFDGDLQGRAWVVFNKCDTLTEPHYQPPSGSSSIFDNIQKFLTENAIPVSQICFTSSRLHELVDAKTGVVDPARAADALFRHGKDAIPASCPPAMRPLFEELLKDGGVGRLRHLILTQIGNSVAGKIRESATTQLHDFQTELQHRVEVERRRLRGGRQLRMQALACRNTVLQLRQALGGRPEEFSLLAELAEHLRGKLDECLRQSPQYVDVLKTMSLEKLRDEFRLHVSLLSETLEGELRDDVIDKLYGEIAQRLESLPVVPVGEHPGGVQEAWQSFRAEDRAQGDWRGALFPDFESNELFRGLSDNRGYRGFDGEAYIALMDEKILTSVRQTIHGLRTRLRFRLRELEDELHLLILERNGTE